MINIFKKLIGLKTCPKCTSTMKPISYWPIRGWQCSDCSGVYAKIEHIVLDQSFEQDLESGMNSALETNMICTVCESGLKEVNLNKAKVKIEYCKNGCGLFFDPEEDERVGAIYKVEPSPFEYKNPRGADYAISVKYGGEITRQLNHVFALKKAKNNPEQIRKILQKINEENGYWD